MHPAARHQPRMTDFLSANRNAPFAMPVAYFTVHMLTLDNESAAAAERAKYTAKARDPVTPADDAFVARMIDAARLIVYPDGVYIPLGHDADLSRDFFAVTTGIPLAWFFKEKPHAPYPSHASGLRRPRKSRA